MSLKDELDKIRTLPSGEVMEEITIQSTPAIAGLLLVKMDNMHYSLPWAQYAGAKYFPAAPGDEGAQSERIEIKFVHQLVTLHGRNLDRLMEDIAEKHVARVPELDERFLETKYVRYMGGPIVTRIDVTTRSRPTAEPAPPTGA